MLLDAVVASAIAHMFVDCLATLAFDLFWISRCDASLKWERANAILRRHKHNMSSSGLSQHPHLTLLTHVPAADDFTVVPGVIRA